MNGCEGRWTDDYGMQQYCQPCRGSGTVSYFKHVRVPEFDAPKPKQDWIPDWIET